MEFDKHFKLNSMLKYITVILFIVISTVKAEGKFCQIHLIFIIPWELLENIII